MHAVDVRVIIFRPEFKEAFIEYLYLRESHAMALIKFDSVMNHLEAPVDYLYNLIFD